MASLELTYVLLLASCNKVRSISLSDLIHKWTSHNWPLKAEINGVLYCIAGFYVGWVRSGGSTKWWKITLATAHAGFYYRDFVSGSPHNDPDELKNMRNSITLEFMQRFDSV